MSIPPSLSPGASAGGVRERKRLETRRRIAEVGLRLFLAHGYEGTTVGVIAADAGISRRTFFAYFKSKDDILAWWQEDAWAGMRAELLRTSPDVPAFDAVRDLLVKHISRYSTDEMAAIDGLIRSSESLMARKQSFYAEQEDALFVALCQVWRQPERRVALRMVALVAIGAVKIATLAWADPTNRRKSMGKAISGAFDSLRSELSVRSS